MVFDVRKDDATPKVLAALRHLATVEASDGIGIANSDEAICVSEVSVLAGGSS
jgi:hypothetical protein